MKIKAIVEEMMPVGGGRDIPGPQQKSRENITGSIQHGADSLMQAVSAGKWRYAESLLTNMLKQVQVLSYGESKYQII